MLILPAIDIIGGKCVRLNQGKFDQIKEYSEDPLNVAKGFVSDGAKFLHIIDLEGAKDGKTVNQDVILKIVKEVDVPVQVGGGIRDYDDVVSYLNNGVQRVILGTSAVSKPELIKKIVQEFGEDRLVVSVDVKDGLVAVKGWKSVSSKKVFDFLDDLKELGVTRIVVTDIKSDGMMKGPNFEGIEEVARKSDFKIISAGGVSTISDVKKLKTTGIEGAIIGKAIYEGGVDLKECLKSNANNLAKRIVPCMDIAEGRVVKGTCFKNLRDAGDPVELGALYSDMGADELVFLDITACVENRGTFLELVERIAQRISIPFTVGGGIRSIDDIRAALKKGADKVSIGTVALQNPEIVKMAAEEFGSQCIVISLDCKRDGDGWKLYLKGGREETEVDAIEFAKEMGKLGAGELLVNSLDRDGTGKGYDIELLRGISDAVNIPVIASSGAGCKEDFLEALEEGGADAVLAATLFHYGELGIEEVKEYLLKNNVIVR